MSGLPPRLPRPDLSEADAFAAFVGGWQLALWTTFHKDGTEDYPFGRDAAVQDTQTMPALPHEAVAEGIVP